MGSNKDGFKNENDIIKYINQVKNFNDMNDNIKSFLSFLFDDIDLNGKTIFASKPKNFSKNIRRRISKKSGKVRGRKNFLKLPIFTAIRRFLTKRENFMVFTLL